MNFLLVKNRDKFCPFILYALIIQCKQNISSRNPNAMKCIDYNPCTTSVSTHQLDQEIQSWACFCVWMYMIILSD